MGILIVDDSRDSRELLKRHLNNAGYKDVIAEESAENALKALGVGQEGQGGRFDLILMDIIMPGIDGIAACQKIKEYPDLHDIPIVMVTALDEDNSLQFAFAAGAVDYITKPINKIELLARVSSVLQLKIERDRRKSREKELLEALGQLRKANEILRRLSAIDGLTGLSNRRHLDEFMEKEWRRAIRDKRPISVIMMDIDHFKAYNDHYGHQGGDDCLKKVGAVIAETVKRPADLAARYGGEEFIAVLPDTGIQGAAELAEKLRKDVEAMGVPHEKSTASNVVTISVGVASIVPEREMDSSKLVAMADMALYTAKNNGRNRVTTV